MVRTSASAREKKLQALVDFVGDKGVASVEELTEYLGVSSMTVYRYISTLEASGLVRREHGNVELAPFTLAEAAALMRSGTQVGAKERLAGAAREFLRPGVSLAIDDSTTCMHLFPAIADLTPMTIMTNSRMLAAEVLRFPRIELIQIGGHYIRWADAYVGSMAVAQMNMLNPDYCIMSTTALTRGRLSHPDSQMAEVKRAMLENSRTKILVLDKTKFVRGALHNFYSIGDIDVVITEKSIPSYLRAELMEKVGELVLV